MHWNNKILKRLWNINVNSCYICLLLIELLPRMLVLWRIICQCKTSNGPIYWLLQAVEFQQSLINLFRSVSLEIQRGELHSRENISSFLKDKEKYFCSYTVAVMVNKFFRRLEARVGKQQLLCTIFIVFCGW